MWGRGQGRINPGRKVAVVAVGIVRLKAACALGLRWRRAHSELSARAHSGCLCARHKALRAARDSARAHRPRRRPRPGRRRPAGSRRGRRSPRARAAGALAQAQCFSVFLPLRLTGTRARTTWRIGWILRRRRAAPEYLCRWSPGNAGPGLGVPKGSYLRENIHVLSRNR